MIKFFQNLSTWVQIAIVLVPSAFMLFKYISFRTKTKKDDKIAGKITKEMAMFAKWSGMLFTKKD